MGRSLRSYTGSFGREQLCTCTIAPASRRSPNTALLRSPFLIFTHRRLSPMAETKDDTQTWPELAIGLYDKLTGRGAEITYDFDDFELDVPSKVGDDAEYAKWRMNGVVRIRTRDDAS